MSDHDEWISYSHWGISDPFRSIWILTYVQLSHQS
jgi:hypothetical protein